MIQKNWQELIKPTKLDVISSSATKSVIVAEPLERGYGLTLGNALRRILLSSLQGAAVTAIHVDGVLHEFSSIPGVREDVTDVVLNIKAVALRMHGEGPKRMRLRGEGPGEKVTFRPRSHDRLEQAGVTDGLSIETRKPDWLRPKVQLGPEVMSLKRTLRELDLVTVCEDAGCPNLSECWSAGTATFMVLGERCTRACGFCLVDTRRPEAPAADEPSRVAEAVARLGLGHAVLTMVARDDLDDGGMAHVARCVEAIRDRSPGTRVETLVSDAKGSLDSLQHLFDVRPDVFNHNLETVPRLYRKARPGSDYAWSLDLIRRFKADHPHVPTKSGLMLGLGNALLGRPWLAEIAVGAGGALLLWRCWAPALPPLPADAAAPAAPESASTANPRP